MRRNERRTERGKKSTLLSSPFLQTQAGGQIGHMIGHMIGHSHVTDKGHVRRPEEHITDQKSLLIYTSTLDRSVLLPEWLRMPELYSWCHYHV